MKAIIPILLFLIANSVSTGASASEHGWTVVQPSKDSRIIYVSSSSGRDMIAKVYGAGDISDLEDPGKIRAYKSLKLALSQMRNGYPDILLLKRGDKWTVDKSIYLGGGRSPDERMTVMAYGVNGSRPLLKGSDTVFRIWGEEANNIALIGLELYAYQRDPNSPDFAGWDAINSPSGIEILSDEGTMRNYLIEDTKISFFSQGIRITGIAKHEDIVIRRNVILNSYDVSSHAQGIYAQYASVLLEENIFDHNGWVRQKYFEGSDNSEGQATKFNHNVYFGNAYDSVFRNNLFLRASSQHNKWSSNPEGNADSVNSSNLLVENNFYYGGEIGIGIGGNTDFNTGHRWRNVQIRDNVLLAIGKNQPTMRNISWYIIVSDWDGGTICGNYLLHNGNRKVNNLIGISIQGHMDDVLVVNNTITGLNMDESYSAAVVFDEDPKRKIQFRGNQIQLQNSHMRILDIGSSFYGSFANNTYYSEADPGDWFVRKGTPQDFEQWNEATSDSTSQTEKIYFPNPRGDLQSYLGTIGIDSLDKFFEQVSQQSRSYWDERLSAENINDYLRRSYGNVSCATN